jgi:hypothetical protein
MTWPGGGSAGIAERLSRFSVGPEQDETPIASTPEASACAKRLARERTMRTGNGTAAMIGLALTGVVALACSQDPLPPPEDPIASAAPASASAVVPMEASRCGPRQAKRWSAASSGASGAVARATAGDRALVVVADADESAVHVLDAGTLEPLSVTPIDGRPNHVAVLASGLVAVTLKEAGALVLLEPSNDPTASLEILCRVEVAAEPWGIAETDGKLLVTSGYGAALSVIRLDDGTVERELALPREPRSVLIDPETHAAFVSHAVGGLVSVVDLGDLGKAPDRIDVRAGKRMKNAFEEDERSREASQGYALASIRLGGHTRLLAPHASVDPGSVAEPISGGGYGGAPDHRAVAPIVAVIDPAARRSLTRSVLGANASRERKDCLLPRGAAVRGERLYVACMDVDAVLELDATLSDPSQAELARRPVPGGPTALAVDDAGSLFVWSEFAHAITRIDEKGEAHAMSLWRRAGVTRDPAIARGRVLFHDSHDARIGPSRACASCHPEGRDDGLVWTSPDGPRQTPTLAGRLDGTAPYGWFGEHATVKTHVASTIARLGGTGLEAPADQADLDALVAFVASLPAPPTRTPREDDRVARGKLVFGAYGCEHCHRAGGSDGQRHDVGSGGKGERSAELDTPTLRGIARTAPYFHDGRYATLDALLRSKDTKMLDGSAFEGSDREALAAYLETL